MDLLLRFKGGFGVDSGLNPYCQDAIIMVSNDVAEKSGRFEKTFEINVTVPPGSMQRFLRPTCDKAENPRGDWYFDGSPLGDWYFDAASALAEWANANYPLNWELGVASDLTDSELDEQALLADLYDAHLADLYDAHLADLFEEDQLVENQLAEAKWAEETSAAEWAEEARLAACSSEGAPFSWNYDVQ